MSGAERNRRYRDRQRDSVRMVDVPVSVSAVCTLIHHGLLPDGVELDREQIAAAVVRLMRKAAP